MTGHTCSDIAPEVAELIAKRYVRSEAELVPHLVTLQACEAHAYTLAGRHQAEWQSQLAKATDSRAEELGGRLGVNVKTIAMGLWLLAQGTGDLAAFGYPSKVESYKAEKAKLERLQREQHTSVPTFASAPAFA